MSQTFNLAYIALDMAFALGNQRDQKLEKQREIYMPNVKPALAYPSQIFSTGFCWRLALGLMHILMFLDTKMLVSPTQIFAVGA